MTARCALLLSPLLAFGQKAPAGVEEELRARVTTFYQFFVDGKPRAAEAFVAEDTKDFYYGAAKLHFESFRVEKITFSDNFTKAIVVVVGKTEKHMSGQTVMMDVPQDTHWKIENGKWCWTYHPEDYSFTPMSDGKNPPVPDKAVASPLTDTSEKAMRARAAELLKPQTMSTDVGQVHLKPNEAKTFKVVFTNGSNNYVTIGINGPVVHGLSMKFDKTSVAGHTDAVLTVVYDPKLKSELPDAWVAKGTISYQILADPTDQAFPLMLTFDATK
jgi:hypothetical protein